MVAGREGCRGLALAELWRHQRQLLHEHAVLSGARPSRRGCPRRGAAPAGAASGMPRMKRTGIVYGAALEAQAQLPQARGQVLRHRTRTGRTDLAAT